MSDITSRNTLISILFFLPVLWVSTGMLWDGDGDMRLVPIVLVIAVISVFIFRFETIKDNFKSSFWIKLLLVNGIFGAVAYEVYGFDSRELRATLSVLVLFLVTPKYLYNKKVMQWGLFFAAVSCSLYGYYYQFYINMHRGAWPINAIPFATICGLVSVSLLGLLFSDFKGKVSLVLIISFLFSITGLLFSQSRGPLIAAFAVISFLLIYISFRKSKVLSLFVIFSVIISLWGVSQLPFVKNRISNTLYEYNSIQQGNYTSSIGIRLQMFSIAMELWKGRPVLGYGKEIKSEFNRLESENAITPAVNRFISMTFHNGYLDKFVLYGVIGGVIFLTFLIYPIYLSRKYSIENGSTLLWAPALFVAICNVSDAPFINAQAAIYYMFIIGSTTIMLSHEKERA